MNKSIKNTSIPENCLKSRKGSKQLEEYIEQKITPTEPSLEFERCKEWLNNASISELVNFLEYRHNYT